VETGDQEVKRSREGGFAAAEKGTDKSDAYRVTGSVWLATETLEVGKIERW
jgi:hypothetical protein